ncbi:malto-oligosyltrehalose synthase [Kitasatospora cineracea]|uniref:Maltooligosyl trehalose synthase n=1 Tax=Kitasatospora cineracea TaxID=88074 RepID=A0A8G1UJ42_9ACTN|nr:malto-oligosyltrehalose synthase [Kitasatospora cineracea]ROR44996.1 maltooligosyl trehalose synthase [Kitasatospora cineracea]
MTSAAARPETADAPTASYRLQLQPGFTLHDARRAVPYLAALGVSHLHLSPLLEAVAGSTHGYDTLDHSRISEQLGGEGALRELAAEAAAHGLALIADVVPNHMALPVPERLNGPLWEVLKNGPDDPFAAWFDIDWSAQPGPVDAPERGRLLLPLLGDRLGAVLEQLVVDGEVLRYHEHEFPLRPGTAHLPLAELLERQWYRLCWWQLADEQVNYRRFFTVNDLIAVRVEVPEVFEATHGVLLRLHREGVLAGFRIDHPDGLADPRGYLRRLAGATGGAYTVVEKILTGDEALPADWACAGTTGYDALRRIDGVLTDRRGAERLFAAYRRDVGDAADPAAAGRAGRAEMVAPGGALAAETDRLVRLVGRICAEGPELADHSPLAVRRALEDLLAHYPVYRPYVVPGEPAPPEAVAALAAPADASGTERLVRELALGRLGRSAARDEFCHRFGQTASAVAAKGVEDTAFYRFNALLSLNEVGGLPERPGVSVAEFHHWCTGQERLWPGAMTALSTHDTKRSADARARLAVLAELPEAWAAECAAWTLAAGPCADRSTAWLLWQTLLAAWPVPEDRLLEVVLKSVREAKRRTSWKEPDAGFEGWLAQYVRGALANPGLCPRIAGFVGLVAPFARVNSLSAALLHLLVPGVPDVFQGGEEPLYTLVDPDNRAPVDLGALAVRLTDSPEPRPGDLAREKLHLTTTALHLRRSGALGSYRPLAADGPAAEHLVAFGRGERVLGAVTRLPYGLHRAGGWRETVLELPPGRWTDLLTDRRFTGGSVELSYLFRQLPVALLVEGS